MRPDICPVSFLIDAIAATELPKIGIATKSDPSLPSAV
jgi:hypothetical protein